MAVAGWAAAEAGDRAEAGRRLDEALELATQIGDPCWEAFALRGMALVARAEGRDPDAAELLDEALACTRRYPDVYAWAQALVLTDIATLPGVPRPDVREQARVLARRGPMPDLLARLG